MHDPRPPSRRSLSSGESWVRDCGSRVMRVLWRVVPTALAYATQLRQPGTGNIHRAGARSALLSASAAGVVGGDLKLSELRSQMAACCVHALAKWARVRRAHPRRGLGGVGAPARARLNGAAPARAPAASGAGVQREKRQAGRAWSALAVPAARAPTCRKKRARSRSTGGSGWGTQRGTRAREGQRRTGAIDAMTCAAAGADGR